MVASLLFMLGRSVAALTMGVSCLLLTVSLVSAKQLELWDAETVPSLSLPDLDGATVDLERENGTLVIVHFFATWCEPCRDELKSLNRLAEAQAERPLRIIAIDIGESRDRVRRFLARHNIIVRYPVLIDFDKQAMRAWGVEMLPTSYVLDAALCPLWKVAGALEWDIDPTLPMLEAKVAELERKEVHQPKESCIAKGGRP